MIDILLTTYNGAAYLRELLNSLLKQTYQDFVIRVLDDASTDVTPAILADFSKMHPRKIFLTPQSGHTGDPSENFFKLLKSSTGDYTMFCDQDDVWAEDKVRLTLKTLQEKEQHNPSQPLLAHTDLEVVTADLSTIAPSFMRYQHLDPRFTSLARLTVQNNVTGCTVLINRAMREIVREPHPMVMYDWWLALSASAFGEILYEKDATVLYRQHDRNVVGARPANYPVYMVSRLRNSADVRVSLMRTYSVAATFLKTYEDLLTAEERQFLSQYNASKEWSPWQRFTMLNQYHAYKKGVSRKLAQIFLR